MNAINLQSKTKAEKGTVEIFWYENENIGLKRTLFHKMIIPLKAFESGLENDAEPTETELVVDGLNLNLRDPLNMDKLILKSTPEDDSEISIYIGGAHNPCDIKRMAIDKVGDNLYEIDCVFYVDFEEEKVAKNETFKFKTQVEMDTEIKEMKTT